MPILKAKKADFNFEWIFAIIAGSMILLIAIYGAVKFGGTFKYQSDTELAKKLSIIIDPMQAGFAEGKSSIIEFNQETKIENICDNLGYGSNGISVSTKSGNSFKKGGASIPIANKYIFSSELSAKKYAVFSKPFFLGFKVSDMLLITSEKYCFINPPADIESEIRSFRIDNFKINSENCDNSSIRVCFKPGSTSKNCNITIYGLCTDCTNKYEYGYIEKNSKKLFYTGNLIYAAAVSDYELYNCNVKRLFYRAASLSRLYAEKGELIATRQCFSDLKPQLLSFAELLDSASKLGRFDSLLISINLLADELYNKNLAGTCEIW